jgi:hypothetical protein
MNEITGIRFSDAWKNKRVEEIKRRKGKIKIYYIGLDELIRNKEALRRPKDLEDLKYLRKIKKKE